MLRTSQSIIIQNAVRTLGFSSNTKQAFLDAVKKDKDNKNDDDFPDKPDGSLQIPLQPHHDQDTSNDVNFVLMNQRVD